MKHKIILLFMLFEMCAISIPEAIAQYTCEHCNGTGQVKKFSYVDDKYHLYTCSYCNGKGTTSKKPSDPKPYGQDPDDYNWKAFLTPEELQAVFYLEEQMSEPYYEIVTCQACGGTGQCPQCHGAGVVTLDYDGCVFCRGTGMCIGCNGVGSHSHLAENPNMEILRNQWLEYMKLGNARQQKQVQESQGWSGQDETSSPVSSSSGHPESSLVEPSATSPSELSESSTGETTPKKRFPLFGFGVGLLAGLGVAYIAVKKLKK